MTHSNKLKLIGPFKQLLTMADMPLKGALKDEQLAVLEGGFGVLCDGETIKEVGLFANLLDRNKSENLEVIELEGVVALPGFIDSHTHICFAGSRARDYAMRNAGKTYLEMAEQGGGIWYTVTLTRLASQSELETGIKTRADRHLAEGVTTIEVKSGYGLSLSEELKMLRAIKQSNAEHQADFIPTCLAAHMLPKDFEGSKTEYLAMMAKELFPKLKEEGLANRIDIFVESSAFSPEEGKVYLEEAKALGFELTVHADQFTVGGSALAVEVGAVSADHLEASTEEEIQILAKSETIATALPGASLGLGCPFTPARKLLDAGGSLAIASDWNPGSAPMGDLLMQAAVLGTIQKLTNAEVLAGITYRAAAALSLKDRGTLQAGMLADLAIFPCSDYKEILYQQGKLKPSMVIKRGLKVN
ncbi:MAG: imidazolonepropionase [Cytophagales bacterium CG12_big_fil_rev_8_21_14_0_65_40_12]|nr:MAG: imidazolonepropionase [Cytophagales bacterium CG12_big_fil_rev_8_21_14_0_65_40_12]PIW03456.1 MAG: imidazolonepropionase [Cytophagales bacterium CG17_big_fil_post_rev_8_21_14_2_50_40_13]